MDDASAAMLFCPPLPPFRLEGEGPFSIGRSRDCEFPVQQSDVSRRHAQISRGDGGWMCEDLGSTNGTLLNGQRLEAPTRLETGDRIELGGATLTFCLVDASLGPVADEGGQTTIIMERLPTTEALRGDLAELPPFAVFQVLEMGSKSGVLEIVAPEAKGRLWFKQGRPVHAESEKASGFDAALELAAASRGEFLFRAEFVALEPTIQASVTELLLEASRTLDEAAR